MPSHCLPNNIKIAPQSQTTPPEAVVNPRRTSCHCSWIKGFAVAQQRKVSGWFLPKDPIEASTNDQCKSALSPQWSPKPQPSSQESPSVYLAQEIPPIGDFSSLYSQSTHQMWAFTRRPSKEHATQVLNKLGGGGANLASICTCFCFVLFFTDRRCDARPVIPWSLIWEDLYHLPSLLCWPSGMPAVLLLEAKIYIP